MTNEELKPCPFCGGKFPEYIMNDSFGDFVFSIFCFECEAESGKYETREAAREAWNRRVNDAETN